MKTKNSSQMTIEELDALVNAKYMEYHKKIDLKSFRWVIKREFFFKKKLQLVQSHYVWSEQFTN